MNSSTKSRGNLLFYYIENIGRYLRKNKKIFFILFIILSMIFPQTVYGAEIREENVEEDRGFEEEGIPLLPDISIDIGGSDREPTGSSTLQILLLVTILTLLPTILLMMTSFTRILIALHFVRSALGTQQMPPNQVMIGLALFMTIFLMGPALQEINEEAFTPYAAGEISQQEAIDRGMEPLREFMLRQVKEEDLALFTSISGEKYETMEEIPSSTLIPAFILGEMTKGFRFGFYIYLPFIVIDMVVASVLMAMGMMMLPPAMISLPFKLLLFVMVDGWNLVVETLLKTFR